VTEEKEKEKEKKKRDPPPPPPPPSGGSEKVDSENSEERGGARARLGPLHVDLLVFFKPTGARGVLIDQILLCLLRGTCVGTQSDFKKISTLFFNGIFSFIFPPVFCGSFCHNRRIASIQISKASALVWISSVN